MSLADSAKFVHCIGISLGDEGVAVVDVVTLESFAVVDLVTLEFVGTMIGRAALVEEDGFTFTTAGDCSASAAVVAGADTGAHPFYDGDHGTMG